MDKAFDTLFSGDLIGSLLNTYANNAFLSLAEDDDQKRIIEGMLKAFNKRGVSTLTVIQAFADWYKEGGFENG